MGAAYVTRSLIAAPKQVVIVPPGPRLPAEGRGVAPWLGEPVPASLSRGADTLSCNTSLLAAVAWVIGPQTQRPPASLLPVAVPEHRSLAAL